MKKIIIIVIFLLGTILGLLGGCDNEADPALKISDPNETIGDKSDGLEDDIGSGAGEGLGNGTGTSGINDEVTVSPGFNGDLKGQVYFGGILNFYTLDLATGDLTILPIRGGESAWPSIDGTEILYVDSNPINSIDRLIIRDANGLTVSSFTKSETLWGPLKLSPDHQTIAIFWSNERNGERLFDPTLTLFSRDGSIWSRPFPNAISYTWTPDGRLLYSEGKSVFLSNIDLTEGTLIRTLAGNVRKLVISPDGQQVAFTLPRENANLGQKNIWIMTIDGSDLRQLTVGSDSLLDASDPSWSPDGAWILVRHGVIKPGSGRTCQAMYAIPSHVSSVDISAGDARAQEIKQFDLDLNFMTSVCPDSPLLKWFPPKIQDRGTLPQETNSPNLGLMSTLYYRSRVSKDTAQNWALDLSNGQKRKLPKLGGGAMSTNSNEFPFVGVETNRNIIKIATQDGTVLEKFERSYEISGLIRMSNDNANLAFAAEPTVKVGGSFKNQGIEITTRSGELLTRFDDKTYTAYNWLPDGDLILAGPDGIYRGNISSGSTNKLFDLNDPVYNIVVSPNGQRLAFSMVKSIWVCDLDGKNLRRLIDAEVDAERPEWSPNGRLIAFQLRVGLTKSDKKDYLWVVAADASHVRAGDPKRHFNAIPIRAMDENGDLQYIDAIGNHNWRN